MDLIEDAAKVAGRFTSLRAAEVSARTRKATLRHEESTGRLRLRTGVMDDAARLSGTMVALLQGLPAKIAALEVDVVARGKLRTKLADAVNQLQLEFHNGMVAAREVAREAEDDPLAI